jgi:hypothetical protein
MSQLFERARRRVQAAHAYDDRGDRDDLDEIQDQLLEHGRATPFGWLYDALNRRYRTLTWVIETRVDGRGPLLASNLPGTLQSTPGYPPPFQARSLQRHGERMKISRIARELQPLRVLSPHIDATMGPPVAWRGDGTNGTDRDQLYVLGGNGRAIALLMAPEAAYRRYEAIAQLMWPDLWPSRPARRGSRYLVVRQVFSEHCTRRAVAQVLQDPEGARRTPARCELSFAQAQELAGATQQSLSGRETPLGEALSLVRSIGLDPDTIASRVPAFRWAGVVAKDTVTRSDGTGFVDHPDNRAFLSFLRSTLGAERFSQYMADPDNATRLINSVLIGFLPQSIVYDGFGSEAEERAMMAALPIMVTLQMDTARQTIPKGWELLPHIEDARAFVTKTRGMSFRKTLSEIERMRQQETLAFGAPPSSPEGQVVRTLADRIHPLGVLLGLTLKRAERARDPSIPIESTLTPYMLAAIQSGDHYNPRQVGFGGGMPKYMPATTLGGALARSMRGPEAEPILIQTRASERQVRASGGAVSLWE